MTARVLSAVALSAYKCPVTSHTKSLLVDLSYYLYQVLKNKSSLPVSILSNQCKMASPSL